MDGRNQAQIESKMAISEVMYCSDCKPHDYQDTKYGYHMRVMNPTGKGEKSGNFRCTVCGQVTKERTQLKTVKKEK